MTLCLQNMNHQGKRNYVRYSSYMNTLLVENYVTDLMHHQLQKICDL